MAVARIARVARATPVNAWTTLLDFEVPDGQPLGFIGGQYLIFDTGLQLPGGKACKRAYSILSADLEQCRFEIAVRRIGSGLGSNHLNDLKPGAEISFSGPWGKYLPPPAEEAEGQNATFILATDTGITAALGLLQSSKFALRLSSTQAVWFVESDEYFLSEAEVKRRVPAACSSFRVARAPAAGHPDRLAVARGVLRTMLNKGVPERAYFSGDGSLLFALRDELIAEGTAPERIQIETFFNHLTRKATS